MQIESAQDSSQTATFRWWYLPSWLGLDAPFVVSTWTWAISDSSDLVLAFRSAAMMFLVVWSIYLLDRLVDVSRCSDWQKATGRLRFGQRYHLQLIICCGVCMSLIAGLLIAGTPTEVIWRGLYVAIGLSVHVALFILPVFVRDKFPGKEFGVGLFFGLGAYACLGYSSHALPMMILLALLVTFNCLVIAAKDAECDRANDPGGASRWWRTMNRDLVWIGASMTTATGVNALFASAASFYISVALAFLGLTMLHRYAYRLNGDAVRALADFALLTPLPLIGAREIGVTVLRWPET